MIIFMKGEGKKTKERRYHLLYIQQHHVYNLQMWSVHFSAYDQIGIK